MTAKISIYLPDEIDRDMKLLARHENIKITELVNRALKMYIVSKAAELEFAKKKNKESELAPDISKKAVRALVNNNK